jgi:hydroxymethylpyrimidine/phosphomethylpyrimidine kinase
VKKVLTIAGADCSGGAGIQADIKTITVHKQFAMSVITALTAQNTTGVRGVMEASPEFVAKQLDCVFTDIPPDAVKIGMTSNPRIISVIAEKLLEYRAEKIVLDPVMVSTSGYRLLSVEAMDALITRLLPLADVVTPNIPEAEALSGFKIRNRKDMLLAAEKISRFAGGAVLIKGGHLEASPTDLLYSAGAAVWYEGERVNNSNTHGTGCTLSSAIACGLSEGLTLEKSVGNAKAYVTGALKAGLDLGKGPGPLDHSYIIA